MAPLEDKLTSLLSDDEGRQNLLRIASMLSGAGKAVSETQQEAENIGRSDFSASENAGSDPFSAAGEDKASALLGILPRLLQALSGSGDGLDGKRVNLIKAISPYLSDGRSGYIERAIRMASVAKAAKDTLGTLGR